MTIRSLTRYLWLIGGLILLLLGAASAPLVMAQEPPDESSPFDPRFGIVDSFANTTEANEAGAGWTRVFFRWDVVQPGGPSDWKPANVPDTFINAEVAAGREVAAVLIGTPGWATDRNTSTAVPPREYWGDFVFKIASQYKGRINHWIIWNLPDVNDPGSASYTWEGTEEDYAILLKEAYTKIKAADPTAQVHIGGLTYTWDQERGNEQYLARLLDLIVADEEAPANNYFFDGVSYHLYNDPSQILQAVTEVRNILDSHDLTQKTIWITETNAPPTDDFIEPATVPTAFNITVDEQADFVIQAFALALAGGAERIAFNKMQNGSDFAAPTGLLRNDGSRRPAFDAFRTVTKYFAGTQQAEWIQLGDVYIVTLNRGDQTTTVLWTMGRTPTTYSLTAVAPVGIIVNERGDAQTIVATDGTYEVDLPAAECSNGDFCFIGGAPRLIVEEAPSDQRAPLLPAVQAATPTLPPASSPTAALDPTEPPPAPPPTLTPAVSAAQEPSAAAPTTEPAVAIAATAPPTTEPPATGEPAAASPANTLPDPDAGEAPPPADLLPDSEGDPFAEASDAAGDLSATPTTVPPVTIGSVLTPTRILWLFIIGLVVFTITYGIQVAVWYRYRR